MTSIQCYARRPHDDIRRYSCIFVMDISIILSLIVFSWCNFQSSDDHIWETTMLLIKKSRTSIYCIRGPMLSFSPTISTYRHTFVNCTPQGSSLKASKWTWYCTSMHMNSNSCVITPDPSWSPFFPWCTMSMYMKAILLPSALSHLFCRFDHVYVQVLLFGKCQETFMCAIYQSCM